MKLIKRKIFTTVTLLIIVAVLSVFFNSNLEVIGNVEMNKPIYGIKSDELCLSLTFDINWAETDYLESILEVLDKYNVKGTFFVMGGWVEYSEDNIKELKSIHERGHEIGNHSYMHPSFTKITEEAMEDEVKKTEEVIFKYTGERTKLFRFPSGEYNEASINKIKAMNYIPIQWNADSIDWKECGADIEYNNVIKNTKSGGILLFHNNAKYTPQNLEKLIIKLKEDGYEFKPVGKMIYKNDYHIDANGIQNPN